MSSTCHHHFLSFTFPNFGNKELDIFSSALLVGGASIITISHSAKNNVKALSAKPGPFPKYQKSGCPGNISPACCSKTVGYWTKACKLGQKYFFLLRMNWKHHQQAIEFDTTWSPTVSELICLAHIFKDIGLQPNGQVHEQRKGTRKDAFYDFQCEITNWGKRPSPH